MEERGWLDVSPNQPGVMKKVRINGNATWLITLKREAIEGTK